MADIKKTKAVSVTPKEVARDLDQLEREMIDRIKKGNIFAEFSRSIKFKLSDFQDFFQNQWKSLSSDVIQVEEVKSSMASYRPPEINDFAIHNASKMMSNAEQEELRRGVMAVLEAAAAGKVKSQKAQTAQKTMETKDATTKDDVTIEDIEQMAANDLARLRDVVGDAWSQAIDSFTMADYKNKMDM